MMNSLSITVLVLTHNEASNIARCLSRLTWATTVLVIDSGSTDETLSVCAQFPNVRVVFRKFDSFASQCNFGLSLVESEWVLSLDADYMVPENFEEQCQIISGNADGYSMRFRYLVYGRPLRSTLYPARTMLYRVSKAKYEDIGHGHRVKIDGPTESIEPTIDHDDHKPLSRWLASQYRYAFQEADHLSDSAIKSLGVADRVRIKIWPAVPAVLFYCLFWKRLILDGWPGIFYTLQRAYAELLLSLELLDRKLRKRE
jgi:glycosyltransferase involved in cell wall biosynthesis